MQERVDLHKYRSKIKKLMYVYCALPKKIKKELEFNDVKINRQQEELGDWHDTYSVISFLSQEHFTTKTNEHLIKLKEKEKRQFNLLLRTLIYDYI